MSSYLKANLYTLNDSNNEQYLTTCLTISSQVDDDGQNILILKDFDTTALNIGRIILLVLFTPKGIQRATAAITFLADNIQANLRIIHLDPVVERRNNVKVSVSLSAELVGKVPSLTSLERFETPIPIVIKNISVGGMLCTTEQQLEVRNKYMLVIELNNLNFEVIFVVLRQDPSPAANRYQYGCQFEPLPPDIDAFLCSYIYQMQIAERLKNRMIFDRD